MPRSEPARRRLQGADRERAGGGAGDAAAVRAPTTRVCEFSTLAVSNRIQAELLRLASLSAKDGKGARIAPALTHTEIASRVSTHREVVTREFTRIGLIAREKNALVVKDLERLADMVHAGTGE